MRWPPGHRRDAVALKLPRRCTFESTPGSWLVRGFGILIPDPVVIHPGPSPSNPAELKYLILLILWADDYWSLAENKVELQTMSMELQEVLKRDGLSASKLR